MTVPGSSDERSTANAARTALPKVTLASLMCRNLTGLIGLETGDVAFVLEMRAVSVVIFFLPT